MSPEPCRLERRRCSPVCDYVVGKADWLAAGLPTEGIALPVRIIEAIDPNPPTCQTRGTGLGSSALDGGDRRSSCVVIDTSGVVLGRLPLDRVDLRTEVAAEAAMAPGATTMRADAELDVTRARMQRRGVASLLVTTPDGARRTARYPSDRNRSTLTQTFHNR